MMRKGGLGLASKSPPEVMQPCKPHVVGGRVKEFARGHATMQHERATKPEHMQASKLAGKSHPTAIQPRNPSGCVKTALKPMQMRIRLWLIAFTGSTLCKRLCSVAQLSK
eukprot:2544343-Amphidinium_carterae.1